jgi:hypothetical protein
MMPSSSSPRDRRRVHLSSARATSGSGKLCAVSRDQPSEVEVLAAQVEARTLAREDIPGRATELMMAGYESKPLAIAAGLTSVELDEADRWIREALTDLGALPMSKADVPRVVCDAWLREIVSGKVKPLAGARSIRMLEIDFGLVGPRAVVDYGFLDEDDFADGDPYEDDIRRAAQRALDEGWTP